MKVAKKFSHPKRSSLIPPFSGMASYVLGEVGSNKEGEHKFGHSMITLVDCHRKIQLEFPLATARDRSQSLAKIELLIEALISYGTALQKEAQWIADQPTSKKPRIK